MGPASRPQHHGSGNGSQHEVVSIAAVCHRFSPLFQPAPVALAAGEAVVFRYLYFTRAP
jgi:hypothetical protein